MHDLGKGILPWDSPEGSAVHAVVVKVTLDDPDAALTDLREQVVPRIKQVPGFVNGVWTRSDRTGLSMAVFESEEAAQTMAEQIWSIVPPGVTVDDVEVRVVAQA